MRFKYKTEPTETETTTLNNTDQVDTQLELLKYATQVQARIKDNITSDFTLCKLDTQDKEGVTNMTVNAYVAKRTINHIQEKQKHYTWQQGQWTQTTQNLTEQANLAFDMYMTKVMMVTILNRNVDKNYLINFLKNTQEPELPPEETPTTNKRIKDKLIKKQEE